VGCCNKGDIFFVAVDDVVVMAVVVITNNRVHGCWYAVVCWIGIGLAVSVVE